MKDTGNGRNTIIATLFSKVELIHIWMLAVTKEWDLQGESLGTHAIPFITELPKRIRFGGREDNT